MKILGLILVLGLSGCAHCSYGFSSYCGDASYSEEGKKYQEEYEAKLAAQKAAEQKVNKK